MFSRKKPPLSREGLVVGREDAVEGTLRAERATVGGRASGTIDVAQALVVVDGGSVVGTMRARRLVIEPGATVRARCRVGLGDEPDDAERPGVLRLTPRGTRAVPRPGA
jgi:cytoskeletal protein CcmA (bactofilin family)